MAVTDYNQRPASYAMTALEDRFEVIKEVGDGSFGSVALARVRANGSSVARRNSMVRFTDQIPREVWLMTLGCHQNHEEDLRFLCTMLGASRGHLFTNPPKPCPPGTGVGHLLGSVQ